MSDTTTMRIDRMDLAATPQPSGELIDRWDTYATVSLRDITARVERFTYWDPRDNEPEHDVLFEVRINGLPETCGTADIVAGSPSTLSDVATVCIQAANLLSEARTLRGTRTTTVSV